MEKNNDEHHVNLRTRVWDMICGTRVISASIRVWDMVGYNNPKAGVDLLIACVMLLIIGYLVQPYKYFHKYNQLVRTTIGAICMYSMIFLCCAVRFLHCLICDGGWNLFVAEEPTNSDILEPLVVEDILV